MAIKTTIFYGELQGETDKCWYVFDGIHTLKIPKSEVVNLQMLPNKVDCEMEIPTWLARKKGII